jgi:type IV pilus assembly protein PilE
MNTRPPNRTRRHRGFTLIELVVAMVVTAILAAIAFSSYTNQVRKGRRVDAKTALLDLAGREERNLSATNAYTNVAANLGYAGAFPVVVGSGFYQVTAAVPDPNQPVPGPTQPPTFLLTATPIGVQVLDVACSVYTVNNQGAQTATDNGGNNTTASCW